MVKGTTVVLSVLALLPVFTLSYQKETGAQTSALSAQTLPVSPSVLATVANRGERLELMVLWRGAPGWFTKGTSRHASYSEQRGVLSATVAYGGAELTLEFDRQGNAVKLRNQSISLAPDTNVLLVDHVDQPGQPSVEQLTVLADTAIDPRTGTLAPFVKRSEVIMSFLQCDASTGHPEGDRMLRRIVCNEFAGSRN